MLPPGVRDAMSRLLRDLDTEIPGRVEGLSVTLACRRGAPASRHSLAEAAAFVKAVVSSALC